VRDHFETFRPHAASLVEQPSTLQQPFTRTGPSARNQGILQRLLSFREVVGVREILDAFDAIRVSDSQFVITRRQMENFDRGAESLSFEPPEHAAF
jgi:hypothetical protein